MKTLELFAGAGGLAKGFELAGFEHVAFVENNKHACLSLNENFGSDRVFCGDVKDFNFEQYRDVDVVAGGPPCQPFSLGGKHKAYHDERDMFPYAVKAIETLSPKAFVFENVKGLLRSTFSEYFEYILLRLTFPGFPQDNGMSWVEHYSKLKKISFSKFIGPKYKVSIQLLNAADYGVPQIRERVLIVGVRADLDKVWTFPRQTHAERVLHWAQQPGGQYWARHKPFGPEHFTAHLTNTQKGGHIGLLNGLTSELQPWRTIRDVLEGVPDPRSSHGILDHAFRDGARVYAGHTGSDYDLPSKTIKAGGHGVPGGENMIKFPDGTVRYLTVFEAKRIQTFPDEYVVVGPWGEAMRQLGNAVPVLLAKVLGTELHRLLCPSTDVLTALPHVTSRSYLCDNGPAQSAI